MDGIAEKITCPNCGNVVEPPADLLTFFCTRCGTKLERPETARVAEDAALRSQQKTQQAADLALDAVQQAVDLAKAGASTADTEAALEAARQAMEAVRIAQEAQQAVRDAQAAAAAAAESARLAAQTQAQFAEEAEASARAAEELRRQEEAQRKALEEQARREAEEQARREAEAAARQAAQTRQAQAQQSSMAATPSPAPQEKPLEYRSGAVVRSTSSNHGLFVVTLPTTWSLVDAMLLQGSSSSRPYNAYASFTDNSDAGITLTLGDAGVRNSAGMEAVMAQYGGAIASVDRANYAPMPSPRAVADDYATKTIQGIGGSNISCIRELGGFDLARRQQEGQAAFTKAAKNSTGLALLRDPFAAEMIRIYSFDLNGTAYKMAVYVRVYAIKDGSGVDVISPVGLVFTLGSALGNRMSKKKVERAAATDPSARPDADTIAASDGKPFCMPGLNAYMEGGTIYWDVSGIATLYASSSHFDKAYSEAFVPFVTSFRLHDDIQNLAAADARQEAAAVQQATNIQIQQMNMQHQAMQAAARQMQAAADARFEAWQRQSDEHHAAFRERTNADFRDSGGSGAGDWSEAIRGVNTYVTSDGREVQLDVSADRAYENQSGDVIGASGGFEPGADWTEIPRK